MQIGFVTEKIIVKPLRGFGSGVTTRITRVGAAVDRAWFVFDGNVETFTIVGEGRSGQLPWR